MTNVMEVKRMAVAKVSGRGQLVIPSALRRQYGIEIGDRVLWIDTGKGLFLMPMVDDPVEKAHGIFKGMGLLEAYMQDKQREKELEAKRLAGG